MRILVTGSNGFIGRHLVEALRRRPGLEVMGYDLGFPEADLEQGLRTADLIFHLAGVNRPQDPAEFQMGNADFTAEICRRLTTLRTEHAVWQGVNENRGAERGDDGQRTEDRAHGAGSRFSGAGHEFHACGATDPGSNLSVPSADLRSPISGFPVLGPALPTSCSLLPAPTLVLSSSIQAALDNPYGVSKRQAEETVEQWAKGQAGRAVIFRLKNVFGKWCRPNYNSVTATFCHNIAHDLPITVSDPSRELDLVYIDDVIAAFVQVAEDVAKAGGQRGKGGDERAGCGELKPGEDERTRTGHGLSQSVQSIDPCPLPLAALGPGCEFREVGKSYRVTLGDLASRIRSFRESRRTLVLPDFSDEFNRCLYATYLSYLDGPEFAYQLDQKTDPRGGLAEFVKSASAGQIFVSRTKPGITRGNHYHHTKTEKFLVVEGEAVIRFRRVEDQAVSGKSQEQSGKGQATVVSPGPSSGLALGAHPLHPDAPRVIEHRVSGREFKVVDIPPGYTHSIENVGKSELITLFWASEVFDPKRPDTFPMNVLG